MSVFGVLGRLVTYLARNEIVRAVTQEAIRAGYTELLKHATERSKRGKRRDIGV